MPHFDNELIKDSLPSLTNVVRYTSAMEITRTATSKKLSRKSPAIPVYNFKETSFFEKLRLKSNFSNLALGKTPILAAGGNLTPNGGNVISAGFDASLFRN